MVSELEMLGFLKTNGTQCRFVSIATKTPVEKIKVGNPWGAGKSKAGLYKVSKMVGLVNANYNTSVRKRIADTLGVEIGEVNYENGNVWYKHLMTEDGKPLPVVHNKNEAKQNEHYLQFFPHKTTSMYVDESGNVVEDSIVEPWLYSKGTRPDYKPAVISVNIKNIHQLKASGVVIEMPELSEITSIFD